MVASNPGTEIVVKERFAYIVVCWSFDELRAYLRNLGFPESKIPKDLTQEQAHAEMSRIRKLFESVGITPTFIDMGNLPIRLNKDESDFRRMEDIFHKDLIENKLLPRYLKKEHVLVEFYFSGHGYEDKYGNCELLLNMPIQMDMKDHQSQSNPYPLQRKLKRIFDNFSNVSFTMSFDACREKNKWRE